MSFIPFFLPSRTESSLGSGISYTYHVSTVVNLECLQSYYKNNYFYRIDIFEEYSSLHSYYSNRIFFVSSLSDICDYSQVSGRSEYCIGGISFSISQLMVHNVSPVINFDYLVTVLLKFWSIKLL